jgi:hypothetical protein
MISKALTGASTKPIVLAILRRGESYGYEIIQQVRDITGGELDWSEPMLYPFLKRLERDGPKVLQADQAGPRGAGERAEPVAHGPFGADRALVAPIKAGTKTWTCPRS